MSQLSTFHVSTLNFSCLNSHRLTPHRNSLQSRKTLFFTLSKGCFRRSEFSNFTGEIHELKKYTSSSSRKAELIQNL